MIRTITFRLLPVLALAWLGSAAALPAAEPAAINPFGRTTETRDDAVTGCLELSNGRAYAGQIYMTRDKGLLIYDPTAHRQREIPLTAIKQVDCTVKREWFEKEWRYLESANDEKVYTGRQYPAREYTFKVALRDGRTITGSVDGVIYVQPASASSNSAAEPEAQHFLLHKRDKGEMGAKMSSVVYVRSIKLGKEAYKVGLRKMTDRPSTSGQPASDHSNQ
jgi:hypothetical protein